MAGKKWPYLLPPHFSASVPPSGRPTEPLGASFWTAPVLWRFRIPRKAEKRQRTAAVQNTLSYCIH